MRNNIIFVHLRNGVNFTMCVSQTDRSWGCEYNLNRPLALRFGNANSLTKAHSVSSFIFLIKKLLYRVGKKAQTFTDGRI